MKSEIHSKPINLTTKPLLNNRNFNIISISTLIMGLGGKIYELSLPLMIYELTHSPITMTIMRGIELLPNLLLAMFIGVLIDRADIKKWSQVMILLQILVLISMYLFFENGVIHLYQFYLAGFLLMTFNYGYLNARVSIVKKSIPGPYLIAANARLSFIETIVTLLGPLLSGVLLTLSDMNNGILITAIFMILSLVLFSFLSVDTTQNKIQQSSFLEELKEGWKELKSNKRLWNITILVIFLNSTIGMYSSLFIYFAKEVLHSSNFVVGILLTILGIGSMAGSAMVEKIINSLTINKTIGLTILTLAIGYLFMFFAEGYVITSISLLIVGFSGTIQSVTIWTFRQESTPPHLIGRVSGITGSLFKLGAPITIFSSGWLASSFNLSFVFLLSAILNLIIFFIYIKMPVFKAHYS